MRKFLVIAAIVVLVLAAGGEAGKKKKKKSKMQVFKGKEMSGGFSSPYPGSGATSFAIKSARLHQVAIGISVTQLNGADSITLKDGRRRVRTYRRSSTSGAIVQSERGTADVELEGESFSFVTESKTLLVFSSSADVRFDADYQAYYFPGTCSKSDLFVFAEQEFDCDSPSFVPIASSCQWSMPCSNPHFDPAGVSTCSGGLWTVNKCVPQADKIANCQIDEETFEMTGCDMYTFDQVMDFYTEYASDDGEDYAEDVSDEADGDVFELNTDRATGSRYKPKCSAVPAFCATARNGGSYAKNCLFFLRGGRRRRRSAQRRFAACIRCRKQKMCTSQTSFSHA